LIDEPLKHPQTNNWTCAHRNYDMSCEEYDAMWFEAAGRCEICRCLPEETKNGRLFIDHHPFTGRWAVRGLLCNACNTTLGDRYPWNDASDRFMANPWYARFFASLGLPPEVVEPGVGGLVACRQQGHYEVRYFREADGWKQRMGASGVRSVEWRVIRQKYSPRRMEVLDSGALPR
jgi:hypothetical protein